MIITRPPADALRGRSSSPFHSPKSPMDLPPLMAINRQISRLPQRRGSAFPSASIARGAPAFIAGVIPLVLATGAGAEIRQAMGVVVFAGMIGVTVFGLLLTPVFYVLMRKAAHKTQATVDGHAITGGRPTPAAALPSPDRDHHA